MTSTPFALHGIVQRETYMPLIKCTIDQAQNVRNRIPNSEIIDTRKIVMTQATTFFFRSSIEGNPPAVRPSGRTSLIRMNSLGPGLCLSKLS